MRDFAENGGGCEPRHILRFDPQQQLAARRLKLGIGCEVIATAKVESFDGRFYSLRVTAHDGTQEIGRGTVGRAVINLSQFMTKMKQKRGLD